MDFRGTLCEEDHPAFDSLVSDIVKQGIIKSESLKTIWDISTTHQATELIAELMKSYCKYPDDANAPYALNEIRKDLNIAPPVLH